MKALSKFNIFRWWILLTLIEELIGKKMGPRNSTLQHPKPVQYCLERNSERNRFYQVITQHMTFKTVLFSNSLLFAKVPPRDLILVLESRIKVPSSRVHCMSPLWVALTRLLGRRIMFHTFELLLSAQNYLLMTFDLFSTLIWLKITVIRGCYVKSFYFKYNFSRNRIFQLI